MRPIGDDPLDPGDPGYDTGGSGEITGGGTGGSDGGDPTDNTDRRVMITMDCIEGGFTTVSLSYSAIKTGTTNCEYGFRVVRRRTGFADFILPGEPNFVMSTSEDVRSWTWVDPEITAAGEYQYFLQINRVSGAGTFREMTFVGTHFKK